MDREAKDSIYPLDRDGHHRIPHFFTVVSVQMKTLIKDGIINGKKTF
jgi:hypothetical protein